MMETSGLGHDEKGAEHLDGLMHHRARRLFGKNGSRQAPRSAGDALQTVEESLTMQYLNTQKQKEALMLAESEAILHGSSPWRVPDGRLASISGEASKQSRLNRRDGERSEYDGPLTSGSFSSSGSAGKQGSFKLNSSESSGTQPEVVRADEAGADASKALHIVLEGLDDVDDSSSDTFSQTQTPTEDSLEFSRLGSKKNKRKKPKPRNAKLAAMLYKDEPPVVQDSKTISRRTSMDNKAEMLESLVDLANSSHSASPNSSEVHKSQELLRSLTDRTHEADEAMPNTVVPLDSAEQGLSAGRETPTRRNSGTDLAETVIFENDIRRERNTGKIWSWRKLGYKKTVNAKVLKSAPDHPLELPLDDTAKDAFTSRSPLEDAANLDFIPSAAKEDELLPDLPGAYPRPGSFRGYQDGQNRPLRMNSGPQENSNLPAKVGVGRQLPPHGKERSVTNTKIILAELERMRLDAEVAEKKLLAAEMLAHRALTIGNDGSESGGSRSFRSHSGLSAGSGHLADDGARPVSVAERREKKNSATLRNYRQYSWSELKAATNNFDRLLGEGGFGTVFYGVLNHTPVAVKIMKQSEEVDAENEFMQEVEVLGELRHPHIMMLLGCCAENHSLVYEFMANGSLEDCLRCKDGSAPLPWYTRLRICAEVASALLNLHSRPEPIVHRDLKPANILLDKNFVAKLGDVGLARIMQKDDDGEDECLSEDKRIGTLAYVDPEFQRTGDFNPKSDVYAFGIVLLDVLTGRNPSVYENIEDAVEEEDDAKLATYLDKSAGDWPLRVAMEVATLAVHCSEMKRKKRPDLESQVMPVLDKIHAYAVSCEEQANKRRGSLSRKPPSYLFCPITQEIMEDPMIASDGHTYEGEAIRQWLLEHDISPLTNQKLTSKDLLPNLAIRTMIEEWKGRE